MIAAILRAQWLSMRSFRLGSGRRTAALSMGLAFVWYGFWAMLSIALEELLAASGAHAGPAIPQGLLFIFLYWQLAPLVSASLGASLDLRKLLVYPVPHRLLFQVEVLLRLTSAAEMLLVLGGGAIGLLRNSALGGWPAAPRLAAGFLAFVGFNLLLAAGLRNLIERLLARKHVREVLVLLLVLVTAAPRLLVAKGTSFSRLSAIFAGLDRPGWPWTATALWISGERWLLAAAVLLAWMAAAWIFARRQFERSLRFDARAAQAGTAQGRPESASRLEWLYRLPGMLLRDPLAAIVEKEMRALSRTPRFRMVFFMGFSFGVLIWLPMTIGGQRDMHSPVARNFLTVVSVYALVLLGQASYWNALGFDRAAAQLYFCLPASMAQILKGKNLAAAALILADVALVAATCRLVQIPIPAVKIAEAFLVTVISSLYLLAMGNLSSIHYPRAMNPERVSQGPAGGRFQALVAFLFPLTLLPVFLAYVGREVFESETVFYLLLAVAAAIGAAFYRIALDSAAEAALRRREAIVAELTQGEGPVTSE